MNNINRIFADRRQKTDDTKPKKRWSDFASNRKAAMEGKPIPLNRPPRYSVDDIEYLPVEQLKDRNKALAEKIKKY